MDQLWLYVRVIELDLGITWGPLLHFGKFLLHSLCYVVVGKDTNSCTSLRLSVSGTECFQVL